MARNTLQSSTLMLVMMTGSLALGGFSGAALAAGKAPKAKVETASGANKRASRVKFIDAPSSERPAARKQRLKQECKGRPNAGMCLGHTR